MRDERLHDRGEQKRLHVHVKQTRDAAYGIVGVKRAEDKVARHGRANRDVRCFNIANLTNHDHVRILSQNVAEPFREGQINLRFHIDLRDPGNSIFHRFFDGDDTALH